MVRRPFDTTQTSLYGTNHPALMLPVVGLDQIPLSAVLLCVLTVFESELLLSSMCAHRSRRGPLAGIGETCYVVYRDHAELGALYEGMW